MSNRQESEPTQFVSFQVAVKKLSMDAFGTIPMDGTALSEQNPLMGTVWNNSPALDSYADLAGTPNATQSINSLSAFTPELEPLSTSTTQMEIMPHEAFNIFSSSVFSNTFRHNYCYVSGNCPKYI